MAAGLILGPAVFGWVRANEALKAISDLAVFLIVLSAGLEMSLSDIRSALRGRGFGVALISFVLPLASGALLGAAFKLDVMRSVFLGLTMSITALPVAIRILEGFGILHSEVGRLSMGSAVLSDLAALLILGVILTLPEQRSYAALASAVCWTTGKLILLAVAVLLDERGLEELPKRRVHVERIPERIIEVFGNEALLGIVILFVLVFSSVSETLGFHAVVGSFFGALLIKKKFFLVSRYDELEKTIASVGSGFLSPIFFAYLGLEVEPSSMRSLAFVLAVTVVAILSKVVSGVFGGRFAGLSRNDSLRLGIILNGRGVMGLVVASIAFERKFIGPAMYSTLTLMSIVTTVLAPILYRQIVTRQTI
jgi:Kef-type K+ transport system membrane component KefB